MKTIKISNLFILFLFIIACSDSAALKQKYLEQARINIQDSNLDKARVELKNVLQIDPKTAEAYSLLGQIEEQRQEWRLALSYYQKAIEINPNLLEPQIRLAQFYLSQANNYKNTKNTDQEVKALETAETRINSILLQDPQSIDGLTLKASLHTHRKEIEQAITILNNILKQKPDSYSATLLLSRLYENMNDTSKTLQILNSGINISPSNRILKQQLAEFYIRHNEVHKAIGTMRELIKENPELFSYRTRLASYYQITNNYEEAENTLRKAVEVEPKDIRRHLILSQFINERKGSEFAINELNHSLTQLPDEPELYFAKASIYLRNENINEAISIFDSIIKKWHQTGPAIKSHIELANIYLAKNMTDTATTHIEKALQYEPNNSEALKLRGNIAFLTKDFDYAINCFRTVLKFQPDSIELLHLLAKSHLHRGEIELAGDILEKAAKIASGNIPAQLELARFNLASNKFQDALIQITRALEIDPNNSAALILKSEAQIRLNDLEGTIKTIERLKKVSPQNPEAWFRMARIYKIQNNLDKAIKEMEIAWNKEKTSLTLLAELTDLELMAGKITEARQRLITLSKQQPSYPGVHKFIAMTYMAEKIYDKADFELKKHLETQNDDERAWLQLAQIQQYTGNPAKAAEYYLSGLKYLPENIQLLTGLAKIREYEHQYNDAIDIYKTILKLQPENTTATESLSLLSARSHTN